MKSPLKNLLFILVLFFVSCNKEPQPIKTETPTITVSAIPVAEPVTSPATTVSMAVLATEARKDWLAKLSQHNNQVEYRKRNQNVWSPAEENSAFMKYDALQTKNASTAEVVYQSGSTLDVKENTLIIFDQDPGQKKKSEDRVIIKSGQLSGKTKTELWVFTDAGLVQIKAKKDSAVKTAEASVVVKKDRAINVKVKQGTAEIIYKKDTSYTRVAVAEKSDITLKPHTEVTSGLQVNDAAVQELATAQVKTTAAIQADLNLEYPADNVLVQDSEIEVRGKLTGAGAKLLINGQLAEVTEAGQFAKKITLQAGTNLIVFQIVRSDASVKFIKRSVRYQPK